MSPVTCEEWKHTVSLLDSARTAEVAARVGTSLRTSAQLPVTHSWCLHLVFFQIPLL